jgi:hypothetical protein
MPTRIRRYCILINCIMVFSFCMLKASAQSPDLKRTWHWYFGFNAGIDFSSGSAVAVTDGALHNYEGCATISDKDGNLLFYTDGNTVWNKIHQVMKNGTNLLGCWSSEQSSLILPKPGNDSIYYIFTTDCAEDNLINGLRYSVINITLDSGRGAITSEKNILLHTPTAEKLCAVNNYDNTGVWVVTHEWNTNNFLAYKVTVNSVDTNAVITSIGSIHKDIGDGTNANAEGSIKISPDGKKIVSLKYESGSVELFDFNNSTGIISNRITLIDINDTLIYSAEFSSNSKKLYISYCGIGGNDPVAGKLYQYDIASNDSIIILNSKIKVFSSNNYWYGTLQLGPDYRLYLANIFITTNTNNALGIIFKPNYTGSNCNFNEDYYSLLGKENSWGLPNFNSSYFRCDTCTSSIDDDFHNTTEIFFYPNPAKEEVSIQINEPFKTSEINIFDVLGNLVLRKLLSSAEDKLSVSSLPAGLYFVHVSVNNKTVVKKLIVE